MSTEKRKLKIDKLGDDDVDAGVLSQIHSVSDIFSQFVIQVNSMSSRLDEVEVKVNSLTASLTADQSGSARDVEPLAKTKPSRESPRRDNELGRISPIVSDDLRGLEEYPSDLEEDIPQPDTSTSHSEDEAVDETVDETEDISLVSAQTLGDSGSGDEDLTTVITTTPYYHNSLLICENNSCEITPARNNEPGNIQVVVEVLEPFVTDYIYLWDSSSSFSLKNISQVSRHYSPSFPEGFKLNLSLVDLSEGKIECTFDPSKRSGNQSYVLSFALTYYI